MTTTVKKDEWPVDMDKLADALKDKLEHVKLGDVTDAAFKTGVWASCVLGTKFLLDMVTQDDLFKWVGEHPDLVDSALKSNLYLQATGGFWAGDLQRIYKEYFDDPLSEKELAALVAAVDEQKSFWSMKPAQTKLLSHPLLLVKLTIMGKDAVREAITNKEKARTDLANSFAYWQSELDSRQRNLEAYQLQIAEFGHGSLSETERQEYADLQGTATNRNSIAYALSKLKEAERAAIMAQDAEDVLKAAQAKAYNMLRWSVSFVIGTYLAGSMVYAGDTLLDSIQGAFNMFKIPFKGGV